MIHQRHLLFFKNYRKNYFKCSKSYNETLSSAFAEYVTVFTVLQAYSTPAGQASGEKFSLPIKVPIYLPQKDERFGMPWRGLNSQHYDYKRVALPTELSRPKSYNSSNKKKLKKFTFCL